MRIGGTEQVIKNLIEGSDKDLFDTSIFCIEQPLGPFGQMLLEKGIVIDSAQRREGFDIKLINTIRQYIKKANIDVLHCHQYTPWVYGALAAIGTGSKVIFTEHGRFYPDRTSWKRKVVNPILNLLTYKITAISKATKQALIDYEYLPESRIEVIYNGIQPLKKDTEQTRLLKQKLHLSPSTRILGTIARLDPIKNHSMMFKAFKLVLKEHPDSVLLLVGDGEERENLEQLVDELGIRKNVIFTGYIPSPQHFLDCMDIFLLPSLSEGTSMTLLEAMSLSKPCVVTDAGGNPEIIAHNENGLVTENDDASGFSDAIIKLLKNHRERKEMSVAAKSRFIKFFSAELMCDQFTNIYSH